ncbi:hypothetical protein FHT79_005473 [Rhizobium sp. BK212]|uniref:hypothetical protein n=1 Tax=Rhizobium sp. BK212 TaxID=2587074 RepID=UPI0004BB8F39|nr:hypothetical protein [Rhizobium sp. BK212]MBB4218254.1 hypothetical protein [Rhizobium sp. BK212]
MIQIFLNSLVAVLIASAFLTTAITALSSQDRSLRKVPVKVQSGNRMPTAALNPVNDQSDGASCRTRHRFESAYNRLKE